VTDPQVTVSTDLSIVIEEEEDGLEPQSLVYEEDEIGMVDEPIATQEEPDDPQADVRSRIGPPEAGLDDLMDEEDEQ
jgi:hypothetical protein